MFANHKYALVVFFALYLSFPFTIYSQEDSKIRVLKDQLDQADDTVKIELLLDLAYEFLRISNDSVSLYAELAIAESEKANYLKGQAKG